MEIKKIISLLHDSSIERSKFATKNGMLQTVKQQKINTIKTILINLIQKVLNQFSSDYSDSFIFITGDITVNAEIMQMLHLKIVHHFLC